MRELQPLGPLGPRSCEDWPAQLATTPRTMPGDEREPVLAYLRACPIFLAWMGFSKDVIENRFEVAGGSAIASDGVYYWRVDAVDYIGEYGIAIPEAAVEHMRAKDWRPDAIGREEYLDLFDSLMALLHPAFDA